MSFCHYSNAPRRGRRAALVAIVLVAASGCATAPGLPDPLAAGWQGRPVCERLHEDAEVRVLRCTFPPGVGHERHFHAAHFGYALTAATMRITDAEGTRDQSVPAGVHWVSEGIEWHEVVNVGETTGVYLIVEPR